MIFSPVNLAIFKVVQVNFTYGRILVLQRIIGVLAPVGRCSHNQAMLEYALTRCSKKAINIGFRYAVVFSIKFTLDCVVFARALGLRNQVEPVSRASRPCSFAQSA